jgi:hypothetical protein
LDLFGFASGRRRRRVQRARCMSRGFAVLPAGVPVQRLLDVVNRGGTRGRRLLRLLIDKRLGELREGGVGLLLLLECGVE